MTDAQKALSYAEGFLTALAAVLQDREYTDGKVGNITLTTAEVKKLLRDVATHTGCDESELRNLRDENSLLTAQIKELREALKPVCVPDPDAPTHSGPVRPWINPIITCDTTRAKPPEAHFADEEDKPHKVSMVVCLNCGKRWIAVRPLGTKLTDLECPQCHTQGAATETGEELEDDGR